VLTGGQFAGREPLDSRSLGKLRVHAVTSGMNPGISEPFQTGGETAASRQDNNEGACVHYSMLSRLERLWLPHKIWMFAGSFDEPPFE
jgi:hypothetical protein